MLVRNIKNCFAAKYSFSEKSIWHENPKEKRRICKEFAEMKVRLFRILEEMEIRMVEFIH